MKRCAIRSIAVELSHHLAVRLRFKSPLAATLLVLAALLATTTISRTDENGVSFWVPGFYGSLAATPQQPGWSWASVYYHADVSGSGNIAVSKEVTIGQFNPTLNVNVNANIHGTGNIGFFSPTYVFATPVLGGQPSASLLAAYGRNEGSLNATIGGTLGGIALPNRTIDLQAPF
jgi:hypothetical protein